MPISKHESLHIFEGEGVGAFMSLGEGDLHNFQRMV